MANGDKLKANSVEKYFEKEYNLDFYSNTSIEESTEKTIWNSRKFLVLVIAVCLFAVGGLIVLIAQLTELNKDFAELETKYRYMTEVSTEVNGSASRPIPLEYKDVSDATVKEQTEERLYELVEEQMVSDASIVIVENEAGETRAVRFYGGEIVESFPEGITDDTVPTHYMLENSPEFETLMITNTIKNELAESGINEYDTWGVGSPITPTPSTDPTWFFDGWWTLPDLGPDECLTQQELSETGWTASLAFNFMNERAYWLCDADLADLGLNREDEKQIRINVQNDVIESLGLVKNNEE